MFIDSAKIYVRAGKGGRGCQSIYRDKYTRRGIRDGGDGGRGSDIIIKADRNLHTLLDFQYRRHFYGPNGGCGLSKNKKGRNALALIIRVPVGTIIKELKSGCVLRDLDKDQQEVIVVRGGEEGKGNRHFPEATSGQAGEEKELFLDLKLIADAGVVGFPNAGKSTLISNISNAHPKIAAYPFTTKSPVLGVVRSDDDSFVIADIPGLIEGSSRGKGLGDKFLRHVERTRVLIHLVDISGTEGRDPIGDYKSINKELTSYSKEVYKKSQIIVANKMDLEGASLNLERFKKAIKKKIYPISALKKEGLEELIEGIRKKL
ncbi:MAG: GTPase ObgE [Candidatus Omnitrophica bacterium]|nr:GTPase ObgE [Candidatus Omnitrophota bacterium]MBU4472724.1 GTPase ObgE [Candidatus Omnitrophota bacterium]MCG2706391.1 GTPase ObgE [Candidatus Omnitrophota bacterium]